MLAVIMLMNSVARSTFESSQRRRCDAAGAELPGLSDDGGAGIDADREEVAAAVNQAFDVGEVGDGDLAQHADEAVAERAADEAVGADAVAWRLTHRAAV